MTGNCAICGGGGDVRRGWCGSPHATCDHCRQAIRSFYAKQPVRHGSEAGRQAWCREQIVRRLPGAGGKARAA